MCSLAHLRRHRREEPPAELGAQRPAPRRRLQRDRCAALPQVAAALAASPPLSLPQGQHVKGLEVACKPAVTMPGGGADMQSSASREQGQQAGSKRLLALPCLCFLARKHTRK